MFNNQQENQSVLYKYMLTVWRNLLGAYQKLETLLQGSLAIKVDKDNICQLHSILNIENIIDQRQDFFLWRLISMIGFIVLIIDSLFAVNRADFDPTTHAIPILRLEQLYFRTIDCHA